MKWLLLGLIIFEIFLKAETEVDAQIRLRFEHFNGMNEKFYGNEPKFGIKKDSYLLSRVIVGIKHNFNENLMFRISMQDSRVFGWGFSDENWYNKEFGMQNNPQKDTLELSQTYLEYKYKKFKTILGRQKIAYGDFRVFGPGEWKNSGKWIWDAAKISYTKDKNFIDIFYGATMLHNPYELSLNHRYGYVGAGLYGHFEYKKEAAIEPILAYKHNSDGNELYHSLTNNYIGFRAYDNNIMNIFYNLTYIKSFGELKKLNANKVGINSYAYHGELGYIFKPLKTKFALAYSHAKGDNPATSTIERFDGVFGASDKYYGRLNLFSWSNIKDFELFSLMKPTHNTNIKVEYHKFYADEPSDRWKSYKIASMQNDYYGDEVDLTFKYNFSKSIEFIVGASYFFCGDFIEEAAAKNPYITDDNAYGFFTQFSYQY